MSHTGEPAGLAEAPPRDLTPLVDELSAVVGDKWVYTQEHQLRTYESDGLLQYRATPVAAVLPGTAEEVQQVVAACARAQVPWVARGAGSGLSGGALPVEDGVLLVMSRMKRILEIDLENGRMCVEPGVTNANVSAAVGLAGKEGDIFRRVLFWSIALTLVMCVLVYLQSTDVLGWMVP